MSDRERTGERSLEYSAWHRTDSLARFVDKSEAYDCAMIDVDAMEYDRETSTPLVLIETAYGLGQTRKNWTMTRKLADKAGVPAMLVLYDTSDEPNPCNNKVNDIKQFRVMCYCGGKMGEWKWMKPDEYAHTLIKLRRWSKKRLER